MKTSPVPENIEDTIAWASEHGFGLVGPRTTPTEVLEVIDGQLTEHGLEVEMFDAEVFGGYIWRVVKNGETKRR